MRSRADSSSKAARLNEQGPPCVETFELPEAASEGDLAVAEAVLARLLVRDWLSTHQGDSARPGGGQEQGQYYGGMDLTCVPPQGSVSRDGRDVSGAA